LIQSSKEGERIAEQGGGIVQAWVKHCTPYQSTNPKSNRDEYKEILKNMFDSN